MTRKPKAPGYFYHIWPAARGPVGMYLVSEDFRGINEYELHKGKEIVGWPEDVTFYVAGQSAEDYLLGGLQWNVFSDAFRSVFSACHAVGRVQFIPVRVIWHETGKDVGVYWALNIIEEVECLDYERTRWVRPETREKDLHPTMNIAKPVFRYDALRGIDVFRPAVSGKGDVANYVSARLKRCLEDADAAKGIKFIEVPAY